MLKELFEKSLSDVMIRGIAGWVEYGQTVKDNCKKRKDVGFGSFDALKGAINETNRKFLAEFKGEEFKEDKKAIEFLK